jgi:hypothetical protein
MFYIVLNMLANHGYLPRDGKNISAATMKSVLVGELNLSPELAVFLTYTSYVLMTSRRVDLDQWDEHNVYVTHSRYP